MLFLLIHISYDIKYASLSCDVTPIHCIKEEARTQRKKGKALPLPLVLTIKPLRGRRLQEEKSGQAHSNL